MWTRAGVPPFGDLGSVDSIRLLPSRQRGLENQFPVVGLVGARQVGKTTIARSLAAREQGQVTFFDLEDPTDEARFADPKLALESLEGLVVIDEVQHSEGLFRLLRVLVDRPSNRARFLVLGSAGPELLRQPSESLAGRIVYHELPPLRVNETGPESIVYLADTGLLHTLLRLKTGPDLLGHPKSGASWEGFAMHEMVRILSVDWEDCYYWATHRGAEIDLLVFDGGRRIGVIPFGGAPSGCAAALVGVGVPDTAMKLIV